MPDLKISSTVIMSLLVTGATLSAASKGYMGQTLKDVADFIINGYGA